MSKLYDDVKKQEVQIDDLQKTVTNHGTRIETLETKAKATPPTQAVNQGPITVKLPDNMAIKKCRTALSPSASYKWIYR